MEKKLKGKQQKKEFFQEMGSFQALQMSNESIELSFSICFVFYI